MKELLSLIQQELYETYTPVLVRLPYQQGALISLFHEAGQIERIEHGRGGDPRVGKPEIHSAIEKVFNVKVDRVRTVNVKGKLKRAKSMVMEGRRKDWKKAYVTLKEGFRLDII